MKISNTLTAFLLMTVTLHAQNNPVNIPSKPTAEVQDFKLRIKVYGAGAVSTGVAELVIRDRVGYQFLSDDNGSISIIDWKNGTITLLDLDRRIKTVVTAKQLDTYLGKLYEDADRIVSTEEKSKSRSDRVSAEISRPLIDPRFQETFDEKAHALTLKNPSVVVDMKGEAETDDARREAYASCLIALTQLGAMRDPSLIPPFTRLEALKALILKHKLRPKEITFVYRLAGPPQKMRLTYELVSKLSERETEAIARIAKINKLTREVTWDQFEALIEE